LHDDNAHGFEWLRRFLGRTATKSKQRNSALYGQAFGASAIRFYMVMPGQPVWMDRDYAQFSQEAYVRNVIAHRAIGMVATAASSVKLKLYAIDVKGAQREVKAHPVLDIIKHPNPLYSRGEFFQALYNIV